jgi:hypothetical protein
MECAAVGLVGTARIQSGLTNGPGGQTAVCLGLTSPELQMTGPRIANGGFRAAIGLIGNLKPNTCELLWGD